jgi:TonB family protein
MSPMFELVIRSSVILLAGILAMPLLRRRSAALRHLVLAAVIWSAAAVVPLSLALPSWDVAILPAAAPLAPSVSAAAPAHPSAPTAASAAVVDSPLTTTTATGISPVALIWSAGVLVTGGFLLIGVVRLKRVASRAERIAAGPWISHARLIAAEYRLPRSVAILQTDVRGLLATWGLRDPRVLLPPGASEWPEDRVAVVLRHELAHVRRHDWAIQVATEALMTLAWFNPLMWVACRRLRRESELACDDAVLERGVGAAEYASHLLALARACRRPAYRWGSAVPMAHPSTLERRIAAMLNPRLNRAAPSWQSFVSTVMLLSALTLPAAAFRAVDQAAPAALTGSVYDTTGAVLPGVELTLEGAAETTAKATSDAAGRFVFSGIAPGRYVLAAALPGFRPLRHEFELKNARDWDRAITLQVGDLTETINVSERRLEKKGPTQPQAAQRIRVGGNIRAPRKLVDVKPVYPQSMREAGREGVVPMEAVIGTDGTVTYLRVLSAQVHPDFAVAASEAVRQWRFSPTLLNGSPVEVVMRVSVTFSLSD